MGTPGVPLEKEKIVKAIHLKRGIIEHAAALLGCEPCTIYNWMKKDREVDAAVKEARQNRDIEDMDDNYLLRDLARKSARIKLQEYDTPTTIFILKALAGFIEQPQAKPVTINLIDKPYVSEVSGLDA